MQKIPANELLAGLTLAEPVSIHAVVTDSRKVEPGCVFVCFPGERVDGHDFAAGAYRDGAAYIIANHPVEGVPADRTVIVPDSARAMIRMASNYRMLFSPKMIGVTGSVGKTTTKQMTYAALAGFGETIKSYVAEGRDLNTLVSIPLAIAGWLRYLLAVDDNGNAFTPSSDPLLAECREALAGITLGSHVTEERLHSLLSNSNIFGVNLEAAGLSGRITGYFNELIAGKGAVLATLRKYTS